MIVSRRTVTKYVSNFINIFFIHSFKGRQPRHVKSESFFLQFSIEQLFFNFEFGDAFPKNVTTPPSRRKQKS